STTEPASTIAGRARSIRLLPKRTGSQGPALDPPRGAGPGPRNSQNRSLPNLALPAQKGRDAVRPPQTHPEARSAAITRAERRPRRGPPRRHRPKPPQARHADPGAGADRSHLRRCGPRRRGRDRRSALLRLLQTRLLQQNRPLGDIRTMRLGLPSWVAFRPSDEPTTTARARRQRPCTYGWG